MVNQTPTNTTQKTGAQKAPVTKASNPDIARQNAAGKSQRTSLSDADFEDDDADLEAADLDLDAEDETDADFDSDTDDRTAGPSYAAGKTAKPNDVSKDDVSKKDKKGGCGC